MGHNDEQKPESRASRADLEISLELELERLGELQRDLHNTSFAIQRELAWPNAYSDPRAVANLLRIHQLQVDNLTEMSQRMAIINEIQRELEGLGGPLRDESAPVKRPDHADWYERGAVAAEPQARSLEEPSDARAR